MLLNLSVLNTTSTLIDTTLNTVTDPVVAISEEVSPNNDNLIIDNTVGFTDLVVGNTLGLTTLIVDNTAGLLLDLCPPDIDAQNTQTNEDTQLSGSFLVSDPELFAISSGAHGTGIVSVTAGPGSFGTLAISEPVLITTGPNSGKYQVDYVYTPDASVQSLAVGESVTEMISITATDGRGRSGTETFSIVITGVNDAPVAAADSAAVHEDDAVLSGSVASNDSDIDHGAVLTYSLNAAAPAGFALMPDGSYSFDPAHAAYQSLAVGESQVLVIAYTVSDEHGASAGSTLTITVTGTNDSPTAVADTASTDEDSSITVNVLANDTDPDTSDVLSVTAADITNGAAGSVSFSGGNVSYDPGTAYNYLAVGESATVEIGYSISDGNGGSSSSTLTITVTGTNDGPTAVADTASTAEDNSIMVNVVANDTDPDTSDVLSVTAADITNGAAGSVSFSGGNVSYDPGTAYNYLAVGESATVEIGYSISDGNGGTSDSTLTITVTGTNDGPTAVADSATTDEDSSITVHVVGNDTDPDTSDTLNVASADISNGAGGSVSFSGGDISYDPGAAYNYLAAGETAAVDVAVAYSISDGNGGSSSSTLSITVTGVNDGPTAVADLASTDEDTGITVSVVGNDTDPDTSDTLSVTAADITNGAGGSVSFSGGNVSYDPGTAYNHLAVGESATVEIGYSISDGNGGSSSSTLTITVTGTNDGPTAVADMATTDEDSSITVSVIANDTDPDTSDMLSVTAADITNGAAGSVSFSGGNVSYDPGTAYNYLAVGESAEVVVSYSISDGNGGTSDSTLTITVTGTNDGPTAVADTASTAEDNSIMVNVVANDTDPDTSDVLSVTAADITNGGAGSVSFSGGNVSYDPGTAYNYLAVGESATVEIGYSISDGNGGSSSSTLTITVSGTNDGPMAAADTATTDEDSSIMVNVVANDTDPDTSDTLSVTAADITNGAAGSVSFSGGNVSYDPGTAYNYLAVGESATVEIGYSISDDNGGTSDSTLTITVTGTNDGPTAVADTASTAEDNGIMVNVVANDTDPDTSDTLSVTAAGITNGAAGSVSFAGGNVSYNPGTAYNSLAVGQSATVEIGYSISDGNGGTASSTLTITVTGTNDGPTAVADIATTSEDSAITVNVVGNDTDPDFSDTLSVTAASITNGAGGSVSFAGGNVSYNPGTAYNSLAVGQSATVEIGYSISDGNGGTSDSTLTITVTGTNDGPTAVADTATTNEDTAITVNVVGNDTDPDSGAVLSVTAASISSGLGSVSFAGGNVTYNPGTAYNSLAIGQNATVVIGYSISDGNGGTSSSTLTVTVTGANDTPVLTQAPTYTDAGTSATLSFIATDPDAGASLSISPNPLSLAPTAVNNGSLTTLALSTRLTLTTADLVVSDGQGGTLTVAQVGLGTMLNDTITLTNDAAPARAAFGFGGDDTLNSSSTASSLYGGIGNDTLNGNAGNDYLAGGDGNDSLNGGAGADTLLGGLGTDTINTGAANDNVSDKIRYESVTDGSATGNGSARDTITNMDVNGNDAGDDDLIFASAIRTALDDDADGVMDFSVGNGTDGGNQSVSSTEVTVLADAEIELILSDFTSTNLNALASELDEEINFAGIANGQEHLFVVNFSATQAALVYYTANGNTDSINMNDLRVLAITTHNDVTGLSANDLQYG